MGRSSNDDHELSSREERQQLMTAPADEENQLSAVVASDNNSSSSNSGGSSSDAPPPLYEESQATASAPQPPSPAPTAPPAEVRAFLAAALERRGIAAEDAAAVAARWTTGSGQELRAYPTEMFRDVFGVADGWAVYMAVRPQLYREDAQAGKTPAAAKDVACCLAVTLVIMVPVVFMVLSGNAGWRAMGFIIGIPDGLFVIGALFALLGTTTFATTPEQRAEEELKKTWYKRANNGNEQRS